MANMYNELTGKVFWARIVGSPYTSNFGNLEWSVDLQLDQESKKYLLSLGVSPDTIRNDDKIGDFVQFKRPGVKRDGTAAQPIAIVDDQVEPWDQNKLIGNGSLAVVRFALNERKNPKTGKTFLKPSIVAVQVVEHVPYVGTGKGGFKPVARKIEAETWDNA